MGVFHGITIRTLWDRRSSDRRCRIEGASDQKLYAANHYATKDGLKETLDRFDAAVAGLRKDMTDGFKALGDRIERGARDHDHTRG